MIKYPQPGGFTGILRKLFIIFLLFTFAVTAGGLILRHSINGRLQQLSAQLKEPSRQSQLSRLLVDLNVAENSFQKASNNGRTQDLDAYKSSLNEIFRQLEAVIQRYQKDSSTSIPGSKQQIARALQQKVAVSQRLFYLHKRFDSLLFLTTLKNISATRRLAPQVAERLRADTVVQTREETTKNSLIRRLKDALKNKSAVKVMTIRQQTAQNKIREQEQDSRLLNQLGQQYGQLAKSSQELILANLTLLTELRQLLQQLQNIDNQAYEKSREDILHQYQSATRDLNTYTGVASVLVLLFIILLFVYIRRASFAERRYKVANSRAVTLAGQKSEILAIMSHEIRNKLMAINGAVYMIKKTSLSPDQEKKITSINLSSSLLLETVNNVLDMSKLEQQPASLAVYEFSAAEAVGDSVEAMRFMAENKDIALELNLSGDLTETVVGDSFRLKQVLINLLSNAIKYTDEGKVEVNADLKKNETGYELTVIVQDTGAGIPKSKQAKLFSPYYQAGGEKPGTGLGLYLCRQLVKMQGGDIKLESTEGQGCTVSFSIPYRIPE